ncbi:MULTISPECIES: alpha/beta fold hydrolase [unclassified Rhodococcus (in: high G+C Gram-positive bacteria)]|uniref:alpha/beta fold hydrolase n=2 Tax=Rhodococcus TaxID=1827 RepID=UPI0006FE5431|nr:MULTISPECIES: alpha/beta hydrolase [unclassified Rhodococcus (in: high G+C Gram-positive bacteria)]KQU35841.1 hypothetical protein ASG69_15795 [Rhodococcus sp. Leaf225]KQU48389.1 hypothetical protein ASH03_00270 [Rhodococcus sp. Leaf258]
MFHMKPNGEVVVDVLGTAVHVVVSRPDAAAAPAPVVVLCGGLASTWHDWIDVSALLVAAGHTTVAIDRPGFGDSEPLPPDRVPTVHEEADRILAVLDALAMTDPVVLVGHSMAGFYVEGFARSYPARTAGLVLLDSSVEKSPSALVPPRIRIPVTRVIARIVSAAGLQRLLADPVRHVLTQAIPPDGYAPDRIDDLRRIYRDPSYLEAAAIEYAVYADMALELNRLRRATPVPSVPVIVAAAHTGRRTPWGAQWLRRQQRLARYLGGRFAVVSPSHHHAMIDQPRRVAALVRTVSTG